MQIAWTSQRRSHSSSKQIEPTIGYMRSFAYAQFWGCGVAQYKANVQVNTGCVGGGCVGGSCVGGTNSEGRPTA
jgi:hypothetical protein